MVKVPDKTLIDGCRKCSLWERATQGVPGEGSRKAALMLVGEQPGDAEDLAARSSDPPGSCCAGCSTKRASSPNQSTSQTRSSALSWEPRGKRRIHKTPTQREIAACNDWLDAEIAAIGRASLCPGRAPRRRSRARVVARAPSGAMVIATYHPSAALRRARRTPKNGKS